LKPLAFTDPTGNAEEFAGMHEANFEWKSGLMSGSWADGNNTSTDLHMREPGGGGFGEGPSTASVDGTVKEAVDGPNDPPNTPSPKDILAAGWAGALIEPSPIGEAVMLGITATVMYNMYFNNAGNGNENYPGPLSYTYEDPSQSPIHQNSDNGGDNPLPGNPNFGSGAIGWGVAVGTAYMLIRNEYNEQMQLLQPAAPKDHTNFVPAPKPTIIKSNFK
jgi:hypothetical protein